MHVPELVSLTWGPVDSPKGPQHSENPENLEEPDAGAAEDGDQGDRHHHDIQAVERLEIIYMRKTECVCFVLCSYTY